MKHVETNNFVRVFFSNQMIETKKFNHHFPPTENPHQTSKLLSSQSFTIWSCPAVIQLPPVGPTQQVFMTSWWDSKVVSNSEVATSQRRNLPSLQPVAQPEVSYMWCGDFVGWIWGQRNFPNKLMLKKNMVEVFNIFLANSSIDSATRHLITSRVAPISSMM